MPEVVPLAEATDESRFGAKATGLGAAERAGMPIPPGIAGRVGDLGELVLTRTKRGIA